MGHLRSLWECHLKKYKLIFKNRPSDAYFVMHRKIIPVDSRKMIKCPGEVG